MLFERENHALLSHLPWHAQTSETFVDYLPSVHAKMIVLRRYLVGSWISNAVDGG